MDTIYFWWSYQTSRHHLLLAYLINISYNLKRYKIPIYKVPSNDIKMVAYKLAHKVKTHLDMSSLTKLKHVQSLGARVAVQNRFVSKVIDRCLLFFNSLKRVNKFELVKKYEKIF